MKRRRDDKKRCSVSPLLPFILLFNCRGVFVVVAIFVSLFFCFAFCFDLEINSLAFKIPVIVSNGLLAYIR